MKRTALALTLISALLISVVAGMQFFNFACGQPSETINVTIKADGSITPPTAPINTTDKTTYNLTGNIRSSIRVERSNIIIDGNGYKLQQDSGYGFYLGEVNNVSIRNTNIFGLYLVGSTNCSFYNNNMTGIGLDLGSNNNNVYGNNISKGYVGVSITGVSCYNSIYGNSINNNSFGIQLISSCSYNKIYGNNITNNEVGLYLWESSSNNEIYLNNFINNTINAQAGGLAGQCYDFWDNGSVGNYWSDYNGTDANHDGIGDSPYVIPVSYNPSSAEVNNTDNYPLMAPYNPSPQPKLEPEPFPTLIVTVASVAMIALISAGLVFYRRRRGK